MPAADLLLDVEPMERGLTVSSPKGARILRLVAFVPEQLAEPDLGPSLQFLW